MRYFYNKAAATDAAVFEADFRYQGEQPQSREAALVMLADSSEAAVRALKEPTEPRVEAVVRAIVDEKIADGQLDDAGSDRGGPRAHRVDVYSHMLVSMYHARVRVPAGARPGQGGPSRADQHHEPSRA